MHESTCWSNFNNYNSVKIKDPYFKVKWEKKHAYTIYYTQIYLFGKNGNWINIRTCFKEQRYIPVILRYI